MKVQDNGKVVEFDCPTECDGKGCVSMFICAIVMIGLIASVWWLTS